MLGSAALVFAGNAPARESNDDESRQLGVVVFLDRHGLSTRLVYTTAQFLSLSMIQDILALGAPLPISLGRCGDLLHDIRELRREMQRQVDAIQAREKEIEEHLVNMFDTSTGDTGAVGERYQVKLEIDRKARIQEWGAFTSWVRKNNLFNLIQKRLADKEVESAIAERGEILPGLEYFRYKWISVTKR